MGKTQSEKRKKGAATRPAKKGRAANDNGRRGNDNALPVAMKAAKFAATDDDSYCNNLCTVIGPEKRQKGWFILLLTLGLGHQLCGHDRIDFTLPMEHEKIQ